jgi:hypothetical protein
LPEIRPHPPTGPASHHGRRNRGRYSFGTLSLLAANNPDDPDNAARMTRARNEARALVPIRRRPAQMMSDERDATSMITWQRGHTLIVLAEYFLLTGDTEEVLPAIEAYAVNIARNSSLFGTMGHIFATKNPDGSDNGPMGGVYGPVNNAGMPCYLGLILARECGITHPAITPAIERMNRFYRGTTRQGNHPLRRARGLSGTATKTTAKADSPRSATPCRTTASRGEILRENGHRRRQPNANSATPARSSTTSGHRSAPPPVARRPPPPTSAASAGCSTSTAAGTIVRLRLPQRRRP